MKVKLITKQGHTIEVPGIDRVTADGWAVMKEVAVPAGEVVYAVEVTYDLPAEHWFLEAGTFTLSMKGIDVR